MRRAMMGILGVGIALSATGCWHGHYQQKMAAFEQRVADRCVEAARASQAAPEVRVVPGAPEAAPPPAPAPAPATTVIIVPQ